MKKILVILALTISAGVFAVNHSDHENHGNYEKMESKSGMNHSKHGMMDISNLTIEQQEEYKELHTKHMDEMHKSMLEIKEIDLEIQKEMASDNPSQRAINKLVDKRSKIKAQNQKDMLAFKLEAKEKFGLEMMGGMMKNGKSCKMMNNR